MTAASTPTRSDLTAAAPAVVPWRGPMRRTRMVSIAGTLALAFLGVACSPSETPMADDSAAEARLSAEPIAESEVLLTVFGMSCPLCANNVDNSLMEVPGVTDVSLDMGTGIAVVSLDGRTPVSRRQLAAAIDRSGFSLQRVDVR